jgi:Tfp pilus assembly protein PilO
MKSLNILLLLVIVPIYTFWIAPTYEEVKKIDANHQELRTVRDQKLLTLKKFRELANELGKSDTELNKSLARVPKDVEQENLIRDISKIAKDTKFTISGLGFSTSLDQKTGVNKVNIGFSVEGEYKKFARFLKAIEKAPRFYGIENFSISFNQGNDENTRKRPTRKVSMNVSLYTFYQGE